MFLEEDTPAPAPADLYPPGDTVLNIVKGPIFLGVDGFGSSAVSARGASTWETPESWDFFCCWSQSQNVLQNKIKATVQVQVHTMSPCLYHESMSIPWVHVYTTSSYIYHKSMSIPWVYVNTINTCQFHASIPMQWVLANILSQILYHECRKSNYRNTKKKKIEEEEKHYRKIQFLEIKNKKNRNTEIQITDITKHKLQRHRITIKEAQKYELQK